MKKWIVIGLTLLAAAVAFGLYNYYRPNSSLKNTKADRAITASELFSQYETDEATANQQFLDKVLEVTGTISEIKTSDEGTPSLTLESGSLMFGIVCEMEDSYSPSGLQVQAGDQVTIKGLCTGMLMDVVLVRCVIVT